MTTRQQAIDISNEIKAATDTILAAHGLVARQPKTSYGDNVYKITIEASLETLNTNGVNLASTEATDFIAMAGYHGITDPRVCFDDTIDIGGKTYTLIGYNSRARKRPFVMKEQVTGKTYVFADNIARLFPTYDPMKDAKNPARYATTN